MMTMMMMLSVIGVVPREPVVLRIAQPSLVMTLEASAIDLTIAGGGAHAAAQQRFVVDRTGCLVAPRRSSVTLRSRTPSNRVVVLGFMDDLVTAMVRRYSKLGVDRTRLERWLARTELLTRTVWVHEIVHRYVFERHALGENDNLATKFLEIEILKEVYFLFRDREEEGSDRASAAQKYSPTVERAIAWIDAHLFEPDACTLKALARRSGASESTLLRSFRRELGCRPGEYWRTRRLDESLVLLRAGRYSVAEVAALAGYDNPTSFGYAFRQRFSRPPSAFLRSRGRPTKRAP